MWRLLEQEADQRMSAKDALRHEWLTGKKVDDKIENHRVAEASTSEAPKKQLGKHSRSQENTEVGPSSKKRAILPAAELNEAAEAVPPASSSSSSASADPVVCSATVPQSQ